MSYLQCYNRVITCKLQPNAVYNRRSLSQSRDPAESRTSNEYAELVDEYSADDTLPPTETRHHQRLK